MRESDPQPALRRLVIQPVELAPDGVHLHFTLHLTNPTPFPIHVRHVTYTLTYDHDTIKTGYADLPATLPVGDSAQLSFSVIVPIEDIRRASPRTAAQAGGELRCRASINLNVTIADETPLTLPITEEIDLPFPVAPVVELVDIRLPSLGWNQAEAEFVFSVRNRCHFELDLFRTSFTLSLDDTVTLHLDHVLELPIAADAKCTIPLHLTFSPANFGYSAYQTFHHPIAHYELTAEIDGATPWGPHHFSCGQTGDTPLHMVEIPDVQR